MDAHREVMNDPERHPGFLGLALNCGELLIDDPLQPTVELHLIAQLLARGIDGRAAWVLQRRGPPTPRKSMLLDQRTPRGEVEQTLAFALAERSEGPLAAR